MTPQAGLMRDCILVYNVANDVMTQPGVNYTNCITIRQKNVTATVKFAYTKFSKPVELTMNAESFASFIFLSTLCLSYGGHVVVSPLVVDEQLLWVNGIVDVTMYRCPLITYTPKGHLLAVAEGRKASSGDASSKFIATKRSTDGGYQWSEEAFIYDDGPVEDGDNLGAVLVDDFTSSIYLFFTLCPHHKGCSISSMMYLKSVDDGLSWQKPVNVSAIIKGQGQSMAFGPGRGIQLKNGKYKGRLLACGHHSSFVQCIYSDDHGETWHYGLSLPSIPANSPGKGDFAPNECQPEELPDGTVMLNMRNEYSYHCKCRMVITSSDGGQSVSLANLRFDEALLDPVVSAHILMYHGILFFSNPAETSARLNLTLRWSYDNGTTWSGSHSIWDKGSGYSCMTAIPPSIAKPRDQKYIYLVYEKGNILSTETVSFAKISIDGTL